MPKPSSLLFHLHPPKTGGKTIESQLKIVLKDRLVRISRLFPEIAVEDVANYAEAFQARPDKIDGGAAVLTGHFCYGLHEVLGVPPVYFSIVRDPVERLKSYYNYLINSEPYFVRDFVERHRISFADLAHFGDGYMVEDYPREFDIMVENGQVRLIAGMTGTLARPTTEEIYEHALANVANGYLFLAPTARVTEAMIAAALYLEKRPSLRYCRANVAKVDHVGEVPPELATYIRQRNLFDVQLCAEAERSFTEYTRHLRSRIDRYRRLIEATGYAYRLAKKAGL